MQDQRTPHPTDAKRGVRERVAPGVFTRAGKYIVSFTDEAGRDHYKTTDARNLTEAKAIREQIRVGLRAGEIKIGDRSLTIAKLRDSFIARERGTLGTRSSRTVDLYAQRLEAHVLPFLGRTRAADVTAQHIRRLVDRLVERGLSGSTIRGCMAATSAMFRHGVRDLGALSRNPVRDLERGDLPPGKRKSEPRYLSVDQIEAILAGMTDAFRPIASTCFWAGTRISEALALRWEHIDFEAGTIHVSGTKSKASRATVPMLPALARELQAHRERQARLSFLRIRPDALVFQTTSGKSPGRRNALRALQTAARAAGLVKEGLEPVGLHDLRHSLAANAFSLGLTPPEVASLLRHANPRVTLTVYAGLTEEDVTRRGDRLTAGGFGV
jgi:integrase